MTWSDFGGTKSTALSQDEMDAEAERILKRLDGGALPERITANARQFVQRKQALLRMRGRAQVTIKELWWLRSINEQD